MMDSDNRNLILMVVITISVMGLWNYFFPQKSPVNLTTSSTISSSNPTNPIPESISVQPLTRDVALNETRRVTVHNNHITGSINLQGARFDDLTLQDYYKDIKDLKRSDVRKSGEQSLSVNAAEKVNLLSPMETERPYTAHVGWLSDDKMLKVPGLDTVWTADHTTLTQDQPVTLSWNNGEGLTFQQTMALDDHYMLTITQNVINTSAKAIALSTFGALYRALPESVSEFMILHEGPLGYIGDSLVEMKYSDLKDKAEPAITSTGGWLGITDKYWLTAFIPDQTQTVKVLFRYLPYGNQERYQVDFMTLPQTIAVGQTSSTTMHLFTGAKILNVLDRYEKELTIKSFDRAVDFGKFYLITKPIFYILTYTNNLLGNFGLAIMLLTVMLKILFFPLANKSYRSMARMKNLQPKLEQIKERYGDDRLKMNQEMMELYKREKVNPMAGCLPMLVQIPVFFALYKVIFITIEMRHAPFYGWIHDLSAPDPTSLFNLFGLIPWAPPSYLMIGIWPLIMGITMLAQQKLNPAPADPIQAKMFMFMPLVFTFMLAQFPAGLVIYWAWNNVLSIIQQWSIMRLSNKDTQPHMPHNNHKKLSKTR